MMAWVRKRFFGPTLPFVLFGACGGPTDAQAPARPSISRTGEVRVQVNAAAAHQVMEGFGATAIPLIY